MAPVIDPITRSDDGTVITVSWQPISLEEARGFFQYQVTATPVTDSRLKAKMHTENVPSTQTSIRFDKLDPHMSYTVIVGVVNVHSMDLMATAPPVTVSPPQGLFQLCMCGGCVTDSLLSPFLSQHQ